MAGFFDATGKAAKFNKPGDSVTGTVVSWREAQMMKFDGEAQKPTNEPDFWPDGNPKMQAIIVLDTGEQDSEDDDGMRSVYVSSTRAKRALIDALRKGGVKEPEAGGTLTMTYTGDDPKSKNPRNPGKMFSASFVKGTTSSVFGGADAQATAAETLPTQPAAQVQAVQAQPAAQVQAAPAAPAVDSGKADKIRELLGIGGLSDLQIATALTVPVEAVTAVRGAA
jgi:hypothetical protein